MGSQYISCARIVLLIRALESGVIKPPPTES